MKKGQRPLTPQEQLANVYDGLADDVLGGYIETDDATNQRASRIARAAMDKALISGKVSDSLSEVGSKQKWTKRIGKDEPPAKGQHK